MGRFIRSFWLSSAAVALVLIAVLSYGWSRHYNELPARPPLPSLGPTYISEYAFHGSISHYLYRFGLFGMTKRMKESDVLLIGSSHVEFGLSAGLLSQKLSALQGRPVHAYNLGVGFSEGIGFAKNILAHNDIRNKAVIYDLFSTEGDEMSSYGRIVDQSNSLGAELKVYDTWLKYVDDWCLDPVLPHFSPKMDQSLLNAIKPTRFLGLVTTRFWDTGDVEEMWVPTIGFVFANPAPGVAKPFGDGNPYHLQADSTVNLTARTTDFFAGRKLRPIYTFVPFAGYQNLQLPAAAAPFVTISRDGLTYFDEKHLTATSRAIATDRLFESLRSTGIAGQIAPSRPPP